MHFFFSSITSYIYVISSCLALNAPILVHQVQALTLYEQTEAELEVTEVETT